MLPRQREIILNAYKNQLTQNPNATMNHVKKSLSRELGIRESTICKTILDYKWSKTVSSPD